MPFCRLRLLANRFIAGVGGYALAPLPTEAPSKRGPPAAAPSLSLPMMRWATSHTASIAPTISCLPTTTSSSRHSSCAVTPGSTSAGSACLRMSNSDRPASVGTMCFPWAIRNSTEYDLFQPLPPELDLAVMDRFAAYIPGWEMPKNSSEFLTSRYGFITDYLAEAFHYQFKHTNRYEEVSKRIRLGTAVEGRDEKGIKKTVCAFLKILHPNGAPTDNEFEEYVAYATEYRRRVKEQMNKRKPDDEFALINLSYFKASGEEKIVFCPESKDAAATQQPTRRRLSEVEGKLKKGTDIATIAPVPAKPD